MRPKFTLGAFFMAEEKSSPETEAAEAHGARVPPTAAGIQVNVCKNAMCANFGVPPTPLKKWERRSRASDGSKAPPGPGDYGLAGRGNRRSTLVCMLCKESMPLHSNIAIAEELMRITAYLDPEPLGCPNDECLNRDAGIVKFGTNRHGTPRYQCKGCRKVFADGGKSTKRQRKTHINRDIFQQLMNSVPLRRIIKMSEISPSTLYAKLEFTHRQCQSFVSEREKQLFTKPDLGTMYLTTDRQKLMVNWQSRKDRRNTSLLSMATADLRTGYVLGVHVNYDATMDAERVIEEHAKLGDDKLNRPYRRYARVWLPEDFDSADGRANDAKATKVRKRLDEVSSPSMALWGLSAVIDAAYTEALARVDIEAEAPSPENRTPAKGMVVHEQVVMFAHFQLLARMLHKAEHLYCFMDQDSGFRGGFMAAMAERVKQGTADAFYVKVEDMTIDAKLSVIAQSKKRLQAVINDNPGFTKQEAIAVLAREQMLVMERRGAWNDYWFSHPLPDPREPEKQSCWLTHRVPIKPEPEQRAEQLKGMSDLYMRATLTAVDRFFMQVRRGITMAERSISSASADGRVWYGKSAYNPLNLVMLLEIFRTYFNYCEVGKDKKTPAMRLGLARGPVAPEDILYFRPRTQTGGPDEESPTLPAQDGASNQPGLMA
jgi:transposase-like protein